MNKHEADAVIQSAVDHFQQITTDAQADMRGMIATVGIEEAAANVARQFAAPANMNEEATIRGVVLAAFEAGQLHQHTMENKVS